MEFGVRNVWKNSLEPIMLNGKDIREAAQMNCEICGQILTQAVRIEQGNFKDDMWQTEKGLWLLCVKCFRKKCGKVLG